MSARSGTSREAGLLIGALASELGINPKTIRYYKEIGLLPEPKRSASGYRIYSAADLERLRFIAQNNARMRFTRSTE